MLFHRLSPQLGRDKVVAVRVGGDHTVLADPRRGAADRGSPCRYERPASAGRGRRSTSGTRPHSPIAAARRRGNYAADARRPDAARVRRPKTGHTRRVTNELIDKILLVIL